MNLTELKKDCNFSIELLNGYIDNELDEKKRHLAEEHLKGCPYCQKEIGELKRVNGYLKGYQVEEPTADFIFNLKERVISRIKKPRRVFLWRLMPILVPVAAIFLFIIINYERPIRIVGVEYRIPYSEISPEPKLDIALPSLIVAGRQLPLASEKKGREKLSAKMEIPEKGTEAPDKIIATEGFAQEMQLPAYRVVRAIVDSTGRVLKVAGGRSLAPEEDTFLIKSFQGKQLAPPKIRGKATQMFLEFGESEKSE